MQFAQYTLPDFCRFSSGISPEIRFANVCVCIFFQKYLIFLISGVKNAHQFRHFRQSPLFPVFSPFSGRLPGFFRKVRAACSARGSRPCSCVRSTVPFNREILTPVARNDAESWGLTTRNNNLSHFAEGASPLSAQKSPRGFIAALPRGDPYFVTSSFRMGSTS